jgi:hypothetical protein
MEANPKAVLMGDSLFKMRESSRMVSLGRAAILFIVVVYEERRNEKL